MLVKVDMTERQREGAGKGRYDGEAASRCWPSVGCKVQTLA
jgi:hypothetical protein